ncbi:xanthine dehydrogenase/oxidase [Lampetra fluviatilis]
MAESVSSTTFVVFINGKKVVDDHVDPEITLLTYIRNKLMLKGTKLGCAEGGCGACTVMVSRYDHDTREISHLAVNACLTPVCSVYGCAVTTVEGIGSSRTKLHQVQERLANAHGSQCGFCTPGMVMSMYALLRTHPQPNAKQLQDTFQGNLCRCTGYRAIIEGYKPFIKASGCCGNASRVGGCCKEEQNAAVGSNEEPPQAESPGALPLDPTQELIFPAELQLSTDLEQGMRVFRGERVAWHEPSNLHELLELRSRFQDARIVVGNTEVGVEVKFKNKHYPCLLAPARVAELNQVLFSDTGLWLGAACTLSRVEAALGAVLAKGPAASGETFRALLDVLHSFAGTQIRNVAAIGGNIITASPISDLNPVLMAAGAQLSLVSPAGTRVVPMDGSFFTGYRQTLLRSDELLLAVFVPYSRPREYVMAFKQAQRHEDDIAIVNAGMRVRLHTASLRVAELSLAYGGMAPTTRAISQAATNTFIDRLWDESLLTDVCAVLVKELPLSATAPGGMVAFRQTLVPSFFFKFYWTVLRKLHEQDEDISQIPPEHISATQPYQQKLIQSMQLYQEVPLGQRTEDAVGRPVPHVAAALHTSGEAGYCDDLPRLENELYMALVTSSRPHAAITAIDAKEALGLPGVEAFIGARDVPGMNHSGIFHDETVFADGKVTCIGHVIGAVVADTQMHAQRAAKAVKVTYEDLQPVIITMQDAIAQDSFYEQQRQILKGNLESGFAEADHIVEGEIHIGGQEHFYLETQCSLVIPKGENGEIEIFSSSQSPTNTQLEAAEVLGVPANRVLCRVRRMGGGFGGKESRACMLSNAVAVAAVRLGRPVRCMLDRDEDMLITGGRHPFLGKYKVGFMNDGRVIALDVVMYSNGGNSLDLSASVMERALFQMDNVYRIPNIRGRGIVCRTNLPSNTAFRGFGAPQGMLIAENWITDVAMTLNLPPHEVRQVNMYTDGDLTHFNQPLTDFTLDRCWDECLQQANYTQRCVDVEDFNRQNRWRKRGIAVIPTKFGISFTAKFLNQAGALVHVYKDGTVLVAHGGTEMGQGLHTKMIQVASRCLGIPISDIHISETSTNTVPNTSPTAASVSSDLNGMAVKIACSTLLERLAVFKEENPSGSWRDWVNKAYMNRISLSTTGFYRTPDIYYDWEKNEGKPFNYFTIGVACSEVEVDCLTGASQTLRTDIVMDVGNSLNPAIDVGQIEGGFMQGLGLFVLEELRYSPEGSLLTRGPGSYKIPAFGDAPEHLHVSLLRSAPNKRAVYSSKAVGEPPLFLAASVFYAIKDAVRAARADAGLAGPFCLDSPASPERVRMACPDRFTKMVPQEEEAGAVPWAVRA